MSGAFLTDGRRSTLDAQNHQGMFAQDYIRVLASAAGLIVSRPALDLDGVDFGLHASGPAGRVVSPSIDVQVKSWSRPRRSGGDFLFDRLDEVQFNKLAGNDYLVPRYLFLVLVPKDPDDYADFGSDYMRLQHLAYFLSLHSEPRIDHPDSNRHRSVRIPVGNVLTVRTLYRLVHS